jgi:uracil-DNA glycosylase family 4
VTSATERRERLKAVYDEALGCVRCPLHQTRTQVVFGSGNADAELMFIGEAPGANEDKQGIPFVGQAGKLLDKLLAEIDLTRADVFVANTIKCRPPGNRDPQPNELASCEGYLRSQVELIEPTMICTLGNFSTKLLRGDPTGITRLHGQPEILTLGRRAVRLYPIFHPAAALYTPRMLETLREDFARLPELLAMGAPEQPPADRASGELEAAEALAASEELVAPEAPEASGAPQSVESPERATRSDDTEQPLEPDQLGLF